ncbi:7239_t:CDS:1, partial [Scutellospora calospora]
MQNKESSEKPNINQLVELPENFDNIIQITNNIDRLFSFSFNDNLVNDSQNKVVEKLCNIYNEERANSENIESILN